MSVVPKYMYFFSNIYPNIMTLLHARTRKELFRMRKSLPLILKGPNVTNLNSFNTHKMFSFGEKREIILYQKHNETRQAQFFNKPMQ